MTRTELIAQIRRKKTFLCVGLDTDPAKMPAHFPRDATGILAFNKSIVDATAPYAVAYKINTAFYEAMGREGWDILEETRAHIPTDCFTIADAKRGDIGNTAAQYAKAFFETYPFDSVTVAPYMGADSVTPFLQTEGKWAIILGLTSNAGSQDFQMLQTPDGPLYEQVIRKAAEWGSAANTMFVIGATRGEELRRIRQIVPDHFLLVPGVGAQGGDVKTVCEALCNADGGVLINVSRGVMYAGSGADFAEKAHAAACGYQEEMARFIAEG